jgi:hypothetical protein
MTTKQKKEKSIKLVRSIQDYQDYLSITEYLSEIGRKGGSKTSERKRIACLRNSERSKQVRAQRKQQTEKP